jgi:hypothetical protein
MRRARAIGLMSGVALATLCMTSSTAAALQWLLDGKPLTGKVFVSSQLRLLFGDLDFLGQTTAYICKGSDRGTVGPSDHDEIIEYTLSGCEFPEGENGACEVDGEATYESIGLPWISLLVASGGTTKDRILAGHGTAFGWNVSCEVDHLFKPDECTFSESDADLVNLAAGVDVDFLQASGGDCSKGSRTSGMLIGTDLIENATGHKITVQTGP